MDKILRFTGLKKHQVNPEICKILIPTFYSYLNASTGFLVAAFHD